MEAVVRPLPASVRSLLQSSCHINSIHKAVEELVYNSLDSKATSIAVRINCSDFSIQVVDNGSGIGKPDMAVIGTKFMTSKCTDVHDMKVASSQYGIGGRALASLIDISAYVGITSHHRDNDKTLLKMFRNGKAEEVFETVRRPSKGTTVEIKGLLYNLKIQRKNLNVLKELQEIKKFLEHMAIFHIGVSFSLRDDVRNSVVVKLPKCKDIFKAVDLIYALNISENWQELQIEKSPCKVKAYLGIQCRDDDNIQFIYVNGRHLANSKLHSIMNSNLSNVFTSENIITSKHARVKEDDEMKTISNPFYILFISCPCNDYDMTEINNKALIEFHNWNAVTSLLKTLVNVFTESLKQKTATNANIQKPSIGTKVKNIQDKVANIIESVLKINPRKLDIQNGIKGKPAKRCHKRHSNKTYKAGNAFTNNKKYSTINKLALETAKPVLKSAGKHTVLEAYPKINMIEDQIPIENNIKKKDTSKRNNNNKQVEKSETIFEKNLLIKSENCEQKHKVPDKRKHVYLSKKRINEVFQAVKGSVKERCRNIAMHAVNLLKKYKRIKHSQKGQVTGKIMESTQRRSGKIVIREFIPFPKNTNRKEFLKKVFQKYLRQQSLNNNEIKSRYDLVQTIIVNQKSKNMNRLSLRKIIGKKYMEKNKTGNNIQPIHNLTLLTYESHCYDQNITTKNCQYSNENNTRRKTSNQNVTGKSMNIKLNLPESSGYLVPSIKSTENNINVTVNAKLQKTASIPRVKETTSKIADCFKQPRVEEDKTYLFRPVAQKNNEVSSTEQSVSLAESMVKDAVYDFDEELNKKIQLSLSHQDTPQKYNHYKYFDHAMRKNRCIRDNTEEHSENKDLPKMNSTYNVKQHIIKKPIDIHNSANNECSKDIVATPNNNSIPELLYINYTNDRMSKENGHKKYQQQYNESVSKYLTKYTNNCCNFENEIEVQNHRIEVTFESRSYPQVGTNESRNNFTITEVVDPLSLCQAVMESSDMFETRSLDFERSGSHTKENRNAVKVYDHCKVLNEQEIVDILPNEQVYQQCHQSFDDVITNPICQDLNRKHEENVNYSPGANENNQNSNSLDSPILYHKTVRQHNLSAKNKGDISIGTSPIEKGLNANIFEGTDANGNIYYLDLKTGMTFRHVLDRIDTGNFSVKGRASFVPKGFSPIFVNKVNMHAVELPSQEYFSKSLYDNFVKDVEKCSKVYEANLQNLAQPTDMDKAQSRFRKLTASIVFDGTAFSSAKVMGQVDCKFITCLMQGKHGRYLALLDQHAADERIHLESLLDEYKTDLTWKSAPYEDFKLSITGEELFYLENFKISFKRLGLEWAIDPLTENEILVSAVPLAILGKNLRKREVIVRTTTAVIRENVKTLKFSNGAAYVPQSLMDLVNMEACRSAVRFGAALSVAACERLVRALARCAAPFQCAHGRPAVTLLCDVTPQRRDYEVDMKKLRKWKLK